MAELPFICGDDLSTPACDVCNQVEMGMTLKLTFSRVKCNLFFNINVFVDTVETLDVNFV